MIDLSGLQAAISNLTKAQARQTASIDAAIMRIRHLKQENAELRARLILCDVQFARLLRDEEPIEYNEVPWRRLQQ
jgi:hypothetical protein